MQPKTKITREEGKQELFIISKFDLLEKLLVKAYVELNLIEQIY